MTAPQQPAPEQPQVQAPVSSPAPVDPAAPVPAPVDPGAPWPPDEQTLMQLQMDARFSIIDKPGDETDTAGRQAPPSPGTPPPAPAAKQVPAPVQQAPPEQPVKE